MTQVAQGTDGRLLTTLMVGLWAGMGLLASAPPALSARLLQTSTTYADVRTGPTVDHHRVTVLDKGVPLWAEDKSGEWYKVRLHQALTGWVHQNHVTSGAAADRRPVADVTSIALESHERGVRLAVQLSRRTPYRVRQRLRPNQLCLDLFGARLAQYSVRRKSSEPFVTSIVTEQILSDWCEITVDLDVIQQTGYEVRFEAGSRLVLDIRRPYRSASLRGKVIALDPGHGGPDKGAVGSSGLMEKDVNLRICLELRRLLLSYGATVVMTRETDASLASPNASQHTELLTRVLATKQTWADLFISVHNNSVGSGDPSSARGTETYYWAPMAQRPASFIQRSVCAALQTQHRYVAWRPFLVLRETDTPRVLVECAYMSHPRDEALLRSDAFATRTAGGILQGIVDYFAATGPR